MSFCWKTRHDSIDAFLAVALSVAIGYVFEKGKVENGMFLRKGPEKAALALVQRIIRSSPYTALTGA